MYTGPLRSGEKPFSKVFVWLLSPSPLSRSCTTVRRNSDSYRLYKRRAGLKQKTNGPAQCRRGKFSIRFRAFSPRPNALSAARVCRQCRARKVVRKLFCPSRLPCVSDQRTNYIIVLKIELRNVYAHKETPADGRALYRAIVSTAAKHKHRPSSCPDDNIKKHKLTQLLIILDGKMLY